MNKMVEHSVKNGQKIVVGRREYVGANPVYAPVTVNGVTHWKKTKPGLPFVRISHV